MKCDINENIKIINTKDSSSENKDNEFINKIKELELKIKEKDIIINEEKIKKFYIINLFIILIKIIDI